MLHFYYTPHWQLVLWRYWFLLLGQHSAQRDWGSIWDDSCLSLRTEDSKKAAISAPMPAAPSIGTLKAPCLLCWRVEEPQPLVEKEKGVSEWEAGSSSPRLQWHQVQWCRGKRLLSECVPENRAPCLLVLGVTHSPHGRKALGPWVRPMRNICSSLQPFSGLLREGFPTQGCPEKWRCLRITPSGPARDLVVLPCGSPFSGAKHLCGEDSCWEQPWAHLP